MSTPNVVLLVDDVEYTSATRRYKTITYTLQLWHATPTYTAGGEVIDLTLATNPKNLPRVKIDGTGPIPLNNEIVMLSTPGGFQATLVRNGSSPTLKNFLLVVYASSNTVHATAAYEATLAGTTLGASPKFVFRVRQRVN